MIELGKTQSLTILREKEFGVYLGEPESGSAQSVLLPRRQVPEGAKEGDSVRVFIYRDSKDRLIATTEKPAIELGKTAVLKVRETGRIGAFLDMGLEKDLLLPFKEQNHRVEQGEDCLVALYVDRSGRLAATMKVYPYMRADSPYKKDDIVNGTIYEVNGSLGAFVAVDNCFFGLIPRREMYGEFHPGDRIETRVMRVREDGKLDLSPRQKAYRQMDVDAQKVLAALEAAGGSLPFTDKASPELILNRMQMSKNAFKRAVGRLLKENRIRITDTAIEQIQEEGIGHNRVL